MQLSSAEWDELIDRTDKYSGSDISHVIEEACMRPYREAMRAAGSPQQQALVRQANLRPIVCKDLLVWSQLSFINTWPTLI